MYSWILVDSSWIVVLTLTVCDDLAEGVQAYSEQQQGQFITLVYAALQGNLCS